MNWSEADPGRRWDSGPELDGREIGCLHHPESRVSSQKGREERVKWKVSECKPAAQVRVVEVLMKR